jgi:hypothetical protein
MEPTRWCPGCEQNLPVSRFSWRNKQRGTLQSYCKDCRSSQQRRIYREDPGGSVARRKEPTHARAICKRYHRRLRQEVLAAYGGQCACCGLDEEPFLTIDHVNGDGAAHRRELGSNGYAVYVWLRRHGYPMGFRVLCENCNGAIGRYGWCPHRPPSSATSLSTVGSAPR